MLSSADLVTIWEVGDRRHDGDRALIVLSRAHPEKVWAELANLPLGSRDTLLLGVRKSLFGPRLDIGVRCPRCGEPLEFQASVDELSSSGAADVDAVQVAVDGFHIRARPVCTRDLAELRPGQSITEARRLLIESCILDLRGPDGQSTGPSTLTTDAIVALSDALAAADPMADIAFELDCPSCDHRWILVFDIVPYLWRELSTVAQSLLDDVYDIARHLGWPEAEIFRLSASRRAYYLSRARA